jgi:hypothetical protein
LIVQKGELKKMPLETYKAYLKRKEKKELSKKEKELLETIKDLCYPLRKDGSSFLYLAESKNKKRILMLKTKDAKEKNKNNYEILRKGITGIEDEFLYSPEFEKILYKKEKTIRRVKVTCSQVTSLDKEIEGQDGKTIGDFL